MSRETFLIVGLGNPGAEYAHTRHNAGFEVLARLEQHYGVTLGRRMLQGLLCEIATPARKLVLCAPQTFMNNSGECVARLLSWYHAEPERLLVIYDDIDLPPGRVRVRRNGGPGTHNGMRSIVSCLGTQDFPRIRVGTGDRPAGEDLVSWVLGRPRAGEEAERMAEAFALAALCAADWPENGIEHTMRLCQERQKAAEDAAKAEKAKAAAATGAKNAGTATAATGAKNAGTAAAAIQGTQGVQGTQATKE